MTSLPDQIVVWHVPDPSILKNGTEETIVKLLELSELPVPELDTDEALVEIAGCSVSHPYTANWNANNAAGSDSFPPAHGISGRVVAGVPDWLGQEVFVPPSIPCGECRQCRAGQANDCLSPKTPVRANYSGFASHVPLSVKHLYAVKNRNNIPLEYLSAVAFSAAPLFQAARFASLEADDHVIVIGEKGSGIFMVHMAKALGAAKVIAVDTFKDRLQKMLTFGADLTVDAGGKTSAQLADDIGNIRKQNKLPRSGWKIFNVSINEELKETALRITGSSDTLILAGCSEKDAESERQHHAQPDAVIIGSRGCSPEFYPQVLDMAVSERFSLRPFVLTRPMSWIREFFKELKEAPADRLFVLTTDDFGLDLSPEAKSCR